MKPFLFIAASAVTLISAHADESFFQLSLTPDIALHSRETRITGLSLNIWGENPRGGVAAGFVNGSAGESSGFSWSFFGGNYAETYRGVQWGFVNYASTYMGGWQDGFVNISKGKFMGLQSGFVNVAEEFKGLQLGAVNYAKSMDGLQIGFANIIVDNGWFDEFPSHLAKGFVFVNWSFK